MRPENVMAAESSKVSLARIKDLVMAPKPNIEVSLTDEQRDEPVPQYTSLEEIKGQISITAPCGTTFEHIYCSFEGLCHTFVEKLVATSYGTPNRSEGLHRFMHLNQPLNLSAFSDPRVLEAGRTYIFPFVFVVPDTLLPRACDHKKKPGFPDDGHLTTPPTLGDCPLMSMGEPPMKDMGPAMTVICTLSSSLLGLLIVDQTIFGVIERAWVGAEYLKLTPQSAFVLPAFFIALNSELDLSHDTLFCTLNSYTCCATHAHSIN